MLWFEQLDKSLILPHPPHENTNFIMKWVVLQGQLWRPNMFLMTKLVCMSIFHNNQTTWANMLQVKFSGGGKQKVHSFYSLQLTPSRWKKHVEKQKTVPSDIYAWRTRNVPKYADRTWNAPLVWVHLLSVSVSKNHSLDDGWWAHAQHTSN